VRLASDDGLPGGGLHLAGEPNGGPNANTTVEMGLIRPRRDAARPSSAHRDGRRARLAALAAVVLAAMAVPAVAPTGAAAKPALSIESVGAIDRHGFGIGSRPPRKGRPTTGRSGAFIYRSGKYTPLRAIRGAAPLSDVPGFPDATVLQTHFAVNDRGETAGIYGDAIPGDDGLAPLGSTHGFVKSRRGEVTTFDVHSAAMVLVKGNNNRGQVVGEYIDGGAMPGPDGLLPPGSVHGFIRERNGWIRTFDVPFPYLHDIGDINDRGQIVGYYDDPTRPYNLPGGFMRQPDGEIRKLDVPGALSTQPRCINNKGEVFGSYVDAGAAPNPDGTIPQGVIHGFVWHKGRYTTFDPAGSVYTVVTACNDRGQIAGGYQDVRGKEHGFLLTRGRTTTLDAPGRVDNIAWGVNNRGQVVIPEPTVRLGYQVATD
jgi:hypothetical protein